MENELKKLIKEKKIVPFVGAGVSLSITKKESEERMFLSWSELLNELANGLIKYGKTEEAELIKLTLKVKKTDYLKIADDIKEFFPADNLYNKILDEIFDKNINEIDASSLDLAKSIWEIDQKLVITTNYDRTLNWASSSPSDTKRWDIQSVSEQAEYMNNGLKNQTVWHLHGHIDNKKDMVLTSDSYNELYDDSKNSKFKSSYNTLQYCLLSKTFLFIGYSLDDEFMVKLLTQVCDIFEKQSSTHFILLEEGKELPLKLQKIITPIYYKSKGAPLIEKIKSLAFKNQKTVNISGKNKKIPFIGIKPRTKKSKATDVDDKVIEEHIPCNNNLPIEDYNIDGGFVGRKIEINKIKNLLYSNEDRIVSLTGSGGLGKTATALKCAYSIIGESKNPYVNVLWFSAKEDKLTSEDGIVRIESQISDFFVLMKDILKILNFEIFESFNKMEIEESIYKESIYKIFSKSRSLLIIDNLETIINTDIINFIKDIPRPSQVFITSRKGLGEIERRFPLPDFLLEDSVELFKLISKERNRKDLLILSTDAIEEKVVSVKSYPLLIKWSIGKICLGMDISEAFNKIYEGDSEISRFVFNDIFNLLSSNAKKCLYSMIIYGEKEISEHLIRHISSLTKIETTDSLKELVMSSFVYSEVKEKEKLVNTYYLMLSLTRGFIQHQLDSEPLLQQELEHKYQELSLHIESAEKSKMAFSDSLSTFGIKTEEDKVAFNYVKTAKNYLKIGDDVKAKESFESAILIAPEFTYLLSEYGKFESSIGHNEEAEKYHLKACLDSLNYSPHFSYGLFLRKQNRVPEAIRHLKKAKELNPQYLSTYNELGRTLSFEGKYEEANDNLKISLEHEDLYINYKHLNITLYYKSDNYKRWAEDFIRRGDYKSGKEKLMRSFKLIKEANSKNSFDHKNQILEKKITQDIGRVLIHNEDFDVGKRFLLKSTEIVTSKNGLYKLTEQIAFESYSILLGYLIKYSINEDNEIELYLKKAEELCFDSRSREKLQRIKERIIDSKERAGIIKFFDVKKDFGVIREDTDDEYTFINKNVITHLSSSDKYMIEGKKVTFKKAYNANPSKNHATRISVL
jgi:Tfp pilus assembly protein PilF/cold shock CspA family protein